MHSAMNSTALIQKIKATAGDEAAARVMDLLRTAAEIGPVMPALSRKQAAAALGVSLDTLDRMYEDGEGPPRVRVSPRRTIYPGNDFRRWLLQQASK